MMIITIKPRGRGNWRPSEIGVTGIGLRPRDIIRIGGRMYRVVRIRPMEKAE